MIDIHQPWWLGLSAFAILGLILFLQKKKKRKKVHLDNSEAAFSGKEQRSPLMWATLAVCLLGVFFSPIGIAGITRQQLPIEHKLPDKELCVIYVVADTSISMSRYNQFSPLPEDRSELTRMEQAKTEIKSFLRSGTKCAVGIISFGGVANTVLDPTTDLADQLAAVDELKIAVEESTVIGEGLAAAVTGCGYHSFTEGNEVPCTAVVYSDGIDEAGVGDRSIQRSRNEAKQAEAKIITVGVGTSSSNDGQGGISISSPDEEELRFESLKTLADLPDGQFFTAEQPGELQAALETVQPKVIPGEVLEIAQNPDITSGYIRILSAMLFCLFLLGAGFVIADD